MSAKHREDAMSDRQSPDIEVQDDGADQILRIGGILVARLTGLEGQRQVDWQQTAHFDDDKKEAFAKAYAQGGQSESDVRQAARSAGLI
jgi:hypothetical protein